MIETMLAGVGVATALGLSASVYYRLGKLETKVQFIYDNINIVVDWMNNNHDKEWKRNGCRKDRLRRADRDRP